MAAKGGTRKRIMDIAQDAILAKGFDATSIEEIVTAAEITKGGFFYHFSDKSALARALIERYIAEDDALFDGLIARARELSDDPLQVSLITLKLLAEVLDNMEDGHPGCLVATFAYQDRLFDRDVHEMNRRGVEGWRERFHALFSEVAETYPPRDAVEMTALADMVTCAVEGGIVLQKAFRDPKLSAQQVLLCRSYVKLLFTPARL
ncbi:TetR/AcrR family transcriptional regulator [Sulfitobacter aestuariivivens]|uniref:TetR/AcrR family transcriptional regulator n=1 Tax=Sulfitobacter aestuariivivens TaxID=2766981 RepID=A0A927D781_9RHOB|nr:TetR/AcrR family transcriptional regulator [Sulfitobacter aestuariivivens]MBD3664497.1 TetR/AcrR family transcriptional regulator [Sulfitobacter aestuariivivens]